jgi:hypothetical protein
VERDERDNGEQGQGFLPPEPPGPEPELGGRPAPPPPPEPPPQQQPPPPQTYGYPPPPPGYGPAPGQPYPGWGYAPQPQVPDNGQAVAGFILSLVSVGLLVISAGLSSIVSIGCAIAGIVCSRNGKRKVDAGETPKHRSLAQAGFIIGWVGLALSVLATLAWIAVIAFSSGDQDFDWENTVSLILWD